MSEYTLREQKLKRMKELRRRKVRRQKIFLGCTAGAILCVAAGIFVYSRSYTLDLKARISGNYSGKSSTAAWRNIEQALEQTTELAVKNSGTKVIAHRGYSSEAPGKIRFLPMNWQRRVVHGELRQIFTGLQMGHLYVCTIQL